MTWGAGGGENKYGGDGDDKRKFSFDQNILLSFHPGRCALFKFLSDDSTCVHDLGISSSPRSLSTRKSELDCTTQLKNAVVCDGG